MKNDISKALINDGLEMVVKKLEDMGWTYKPLYYDDKEGIETYSFTLPDKFDKEAYWKVLIEDHHNEVDVDDWTIYSSHHDPDDKNWFGEQLEDTPGAIECEAMRLFVTFIDILEIERKRKGVRLDEYNFEG